MVFSLYIRLVFSFSCIDRQLSFFILSVLLSTWTTRQWQMLAVQQRMQDDGPDVGASRPPLQLMERPATNDLERARKATGWSASRCRYVEVSEQLSTETCVKEVVDFLTATDVGKFPPQTGGSVVAGRLF
jgi:hypothetical protein